jgi:hypothetical protein
VAVVEVALDQAMRVPLLLALELMQK